MARGEEVVSRAIRFWKLEGAGNDFLGLDGRLGGFKLNRKKITDLCDRRRGVGADGVLVVEKPKRRGADFRMRYYNSDGGEAEMCGNGARCFALLARAVSGRKGNVLRIQTQAGLVTLQIRGQEVQVSMTEPTRLRLGKKVVVAGRKVVVDFLNTGVPHAVLFVRSVRSVDVAQLGRAIRYHSAFAPSGTNVNFVEIGRGNRIHVRTYERGVEGETLACGTGVVASSILSNLRRGLRSPILVTTRGGDHLRVGFSMVNGQARKVTLQGPARIVYTGVIHV
ncbi:MAG: diaminopimelate epimerase [Verrucomicrobia bacterium]|jgi:diaminopimelate epimerase|nr:diaminopimelate epimerase [Verrucomicrobiota bacterium]NBS86627.1 diaminopimelate epimerase [Verrucomicrobiota bacterium]